jgi:hypothetical protein
MVMKLKYNFSNQCYNDIVKLYQSKKIVSDLSMNYEKIDVCEKIAYCSRRSTRMTPKS